MGTSALGSVFSKPQNLCPFCPDSRKKIELNGLTKRIDLLVTEKTQPKILIECKAPQIKLSEKLLNKLPVIILY